MITVGSWIVGVVFTVAFCYVVWYVVRRLEE